MGSSVAALHVSEYISLKLVLDSLQHCHQMPICLSCLRHFAVVFVLRFSSDIACAVIFFSCYVHCCRAAVHPGLNGIAFCICQQWLEASRSA